MLRNQTRLLLLALFVQVPWSGLSCLTSTALGDEELSRAADSTKHDQLMKRHDALVQQIDAAWRRHDDARAYAGLQELSQLYRQIYPRSNYPAGHRLMVMCHRDLCRLSQKLGKDVALLKYCQEGLAMCRQLFSRDQFPHGHIETANMLANLGRAWMQNDRPSKARDCLLKAVAMNEELREHGQPAFDGHVAAKLNISVAKAHIRNGDDPSALEFTTQAVQLCCDLPENVEYVSRLQLSSQCYLTHGKALSAVGDYKSASDALQKALDDSFRHFLIRRSTESCCMLIDAHIEMGGLLAHKNDLPHAKWQLSKAQRLVASLDQDSTDARDRVSRLHIHLGWVSHFDSLDDVTLEPRIGDEGLSHCQDSQLHQALILGAASQRRGDSATAEIAFETACEISKRYCQSRDDVHPLVVVANVFAGRFFQSVGKYRKAQAFFAESLSVARKLYSLPFYSNRHPLLEVALHEAATQLWLLGETESSAVLYREAMQMCERLYPPEDYPNGHRQLMAAYSDWGMVLASDGDREGAAAFFEKAHRIAVAQFPESEYPRGHDELAAVWRQLGELERDRGRLGVAQEFFERALASYERRYGTLYSDGHVRVAVTLSEIGRTRCLAGDYELAERFFRRSLEMRRRLFPVREYPDGHPSLATALRDLGRVFHASAQYDKAFQLFSESAGIEQAVAESFVGGGSEALLLNLAARKFESLDCLLESWRHADIPASEAYEHVWRRRGFVPRLIGQRHRAMREFSNAGTDTDRKAYIDLRRELSRALLVSASHDQPGEESGIEMVRRLSAQKEELESRLTSQLTLPDRPDVDRAQDPQQLSSKLPRGAVLVDYVRYRVGQPAFGQGVTEGRFDLMAFVIAPGQPVDCVYLGDAELVERAARQWRMDLLDGLRNGAGHTLRQLAWDPVSKCFPSGTSTVYIAPDGDLSTTAWNALPLPDNVSLLIEQFAIATVPHGMFLSESLSALPGTPSQRSKVLAVGDLDFGKPFEGDDQDAQGLQLLTWRPLSGSRTEMEDLALVAGRRECVWLSGSEATTKMVLQLLPDCRWAHFATHGFFIDETLQQSLKLAAGTVDNRELTRNRSRTSVLRRSPFVRSGLALSGANEVAQCDQYGIPLAVEAILTAESIAAVDCRELELVVLSACESGRGDVVHGDGVFGIQTAFHVAGARNVIATLWKIDDQVTAELMRAFYQQLWVEGQKPLAALREAQLQMLRRGRYPDQQARGPELSKTVPLPKAAKTGRSALPRHWAAFMLSGPGF